jgi:hypothetical protein
MAPQVNPADFGPSARNDIGVGDADTRDGKDPARRPIGVVDHRANDEQCPIGGDRLCHDDLAIFGESLGKPVCLAFSE